MKIGIVGNGFIGSTLDKTFSRLKNYEVRVFDINSELCKNDHDSVCECDIIFVCLPTPMILETGECCTTIVEKAINDIRQKNKDNIIVVKSTIPPGTTEKFNFHFNNILFSPEFLTEADAYNDFIKLPYQIVGFPDIETREKAEVVQKLFFDAYTQGVMNCDKVYMLHSRTAEMCKYIRNCFLAVRLSYFNEIKQICDASGINYEIVKKVAGLDERVGDFYNNIDEDEPEYSGSCLPKDINALIYFAKLKEVDPKMLKASWKKNLEVSKKRTWESLKGRAVAESEKE